MPLPTAYFWTKAPFVRLLIALAAGIVLQWQLQFSFPGLLVLLCTSFIVAVFYFFISLKWKYRLAHFNGIAVNLLIASAGAMLVWLHDIRHHKNWIGYNGSEHQSILVSIEEPLIEKTNSFKALASIRGIYSQKLFETII